ARPAYLVEASDVLWLLDPEPVRFEYNAEWAFSYWSELQQLLRTEAETQQVSLSDFALERMMLEAAVHIHALVVNLLCLAMKQAVCLPEFQDLQREETFEIRVAEYLDQSVSVYKEDRRPMESNEIQAWLEEREEHAYSYQALTRVRLPDGDYSQLDFRYTAFRQVGMERSRLHACILVGSVWQDCRLEETDFTYSLLHGADFSGYSMNNAILDVVIGDTGDGSDAWLDWEPLGFSGVDFTGASLQGASFKEAQLQGAVFQTASLQNASFIGADLTGACFAGADVTGASFAGTRLAKADFTGAKVHGVRFTEEQLGEAIGLTEMTTASPSLLRTMDISVADVTSKGGTTP
uniref:pentapeptide repeat-containing protein n=1 Tax=Paenibacillus zanthoxyli TaxID=369399 RepID=UPI000470FE12